VSQLQTLLDDGARFDAEYRGGLSNHLPMALLALQRLGADEARLAAFAAAYSARLDPAPPAADWPAGEPWPTRLGERAAWPAYRALFAEWLSYEHPEQVLEQVLPQLMAGCGAAAFHGLIRAAYAAQAGHDGELADALAYWACRWLPLDGTLPATEHGLIFERMQIAAAQPGFEEAVDAVALDAGTLERLSRSSAMLYAESGNFTVLHLVTSCHAMRVLLPYTDDGLAAVDEYIVAHVAGLHASGATAGEPAPLLPWDALIAAALTSDDEHLIKLVDSAREEEAAYGGNEWQRAASRAVGAVLDASR
jgi:hypothetical protein